MARRPPAPPSPTAQAVVRIGELISRGATPDRVGREAERIAKEWAAEGDEGRERCQTVAEQLAEGVAAAEEALDDIDQDDKAAARGAKATASALKAAREAFAGPSAEAAAA